MNRIFFHILIYFQVVISLCLLCSASLERKRDAAEAKEARDSYHHEIPPVFGDLGAESLLTNNSDLFHNEVQNVINGPPSLDPSPNRRLAGGPLTDPLKTSDTILLTTAVRSLFGRKKRRRSRKRKRRRQQEFDSSDYYDYFDDYEDIPRRKRMNKRRRMELQRKWRHRMKNKSMHQYHEGKRYRNRMKSSNGKPFSGGRSSKVRRRFRGYENRYRHYGHKSPASFFYDDPEHYPNDSGVDYSRNDNYRDASFSNFRGNPDYFDFKDERRSRFHHSKPFKSDGYPPSLKDQYLGRSEHKPYRKNSPYSLRSNGHVHEDYSYYDDPYYPQDYYDDESEYAPVLRSKSRNKSSWLRSLFKSPQKIFQSRKRRSRHKRRRSPKQIRMQSGRFPSYDPWAVRSSKKPQNSIRSLAEDHTNSLQHYSGSSQLQYPFESELVGPRMPVEGSSYPTVATGGSLSPQLVRHDGTLGRYREPMGFAADSITQAPIVYGKFRPLPSASSLGVSAIQSSKKHFIPSEPAPFFGEPSAANGLTLAPSQVTQPQLTSQSKLYAAHFNSPITDNKQSYSSNGNNFSSVVSNGAQRPQNIMLEATQMKGRQDLRHLKQLKFSTLPEERDLLRFQQSSSRLSHLPQLTVNDI